MSPKFSLRRLVSSVRQTVKVQQHFIRFLKPREPRKLKNFMFKKSRNVQEINHMSTLCTCLLSQSFFVLLYYSLKKSSANVFDAKKDCANYNPRIWLSNLSLSKIGNTGRSYFGNLGHHLKPWLQWYNNWHSIRVSWNCL